MTATCPCCGQSLPSGAQAAGEDFLLRLPDAQSDKPRPQPESEAGAGARIMTVIVGIAALWLIASMLFSSVLTGEDNPSAADTIAAPGPTGPAPVAATPDRAVTGTAPSNAVGPDSTALVPPPDGRIAYATRDGLVVVSVERGEVSATEILPADNDVERDFSRARFLSSDPETYPIAWSYALVVVPPGYDDGPDRLIVNKLAGSFTRMSAPGDFASVIDTQDNQDLFPFKVSIVGSDQGDRVELATGSRPLLVDQLGVLIPTPDGTDLATSAGFARLSDHEVLAATPNARIEQRCTTTFSCRRFLVAADASETQLPADLSFTGDRYELSPDGTMALRVDADARGTVFFPSVTPGNEATAILEGSRITTTQWAKDSSYLTWLELGDSPQLHMFFPESRDQIVIDLDSLGSGTPVSTDLLIID